MLNTILLTFKAHWQQFSILLWLTPDDFTCQREAPTKFEMKGSRIGSRLINRRRARDVFLESEQEINTSVCFRGKENESGSDIVYNTNKQYK